MTAGDKDIKNKEDILTLLDAAWEPEKGLQSYTAEDVKKRILPSSGNRLTDKTSKQAAKVLGVTGEAPIKGLILEELPELMLLLLSHFSLVQLCATP